LSEKKEDAGSVSSLSVDTQKTLSTAQGPDRSVQKSKATTPTTSRFLNDLEKSAARSPPQNSSSHPTTTPEIVIVSPLFDKGLVPQSHQDDERPTTEVETGGLAVTTLRQDEQPATEGETGGVAAATPVPQADEVATATKQQLAPPQPPNQLQKKKTGTIPKQPPKLITPKQKTLNSPKTICSPASNPSVNNRPRGKNLLANSLRAPI
jgi:hypothetical protein